MSKSLVDPKVEIFRLHRAWFKANEGVQDGEAS
jgi:hypothetical protein